MIQSQKTVEIPHLLRLLQERPPGEIYLLSIKQIVMDGLKAAEDPIITDISWNDDKSIITVEVNGFHARFGSDGNRLLFSCSCKNPYQRSHCSHIITAWACLKRLVSPNSFPTTRFSQHNMQQVARITGEQNFIPEPTPGNLKPKIAHYLNMLKKSVRTPTIPGFSDIPCRLVLSADEYDELTGHICRGNERLNSWSSDNLPSDVRSFLIKHPRFDSSKRYMDDFQKHFNSRIPLIFKGNNGSEITVSYLQKEPLAASVCFDHDGDKVNILPRLNNNLPLPEELLLGEELLLDVGKARIYPLHDRELWEICYKLSEDEEPEDLDDDEYWDEDDEDDEDNEDIYVSLDDYFDGEELTGDILKDGVTISSDEFNKTGVLLKTVNNKEPLKGLFFLHEKKMNKPITSSPSYRLFTPELRPDKLVRLSPQLLCDNIILPFSGHTFRFLGNRYHPALNGAIRTKKRFRALLEIAFQLSDEPDKTARTRFIRTALTNKEFAKREIRSRATSFLQQFAMQCQEKHALLTVHTDGWHITEEDRLEQVRFLQILLHLYGSDLFTDALFPGTVEVPYKRFMESLPELVSRLAALGTQLEFGSNPVLTTSLQFSLDARVSSIDWFELKPEVRINGELLTESEIKGLLDGNPLLQRDGKLLLLDQLSSEILAMFSNAMPVKKGKKGKPQIVRVPRLQILDWLQLRKHGVDVQLTPEDADVLESLLNFEQLPRLALPEGVVAELRHYQEDAWHWLAFLYQHRFGACLADDMGLGKTLQGITLMAGIMAGAVQSAAPGSPHLVVAPPSLLFNWEAEISRFLPSAKVLLFTGSGRKTDLFGNYDIIITSYGIVQRDHKKLEDIRFDVVIFDETQVVKNLQAATTNAVRRLKGSFVLALTGTPVENHLGEYYAIMDLCLPGLLGNYDEFNRRINKDGRPAIQRLIQRTRPFILRRTKQMIASELPPKIESDIHLELSPKQKLLYQRTVEEVKGQVQDAYKNHAMAQARIIALTAILRLRQICLAPSLAVPSATDSSPKLDFLAEQLLELRDEGHSVLVFSQFTSFLDIIEKGLKKHGIACLRLDGKTAVPNRKKLVQTFQNSTEQMVFLISLKAGGKGLNLTRATYVYHLDPWWNPAVENQASDRAHRIGQTEQVTITRLIMRHTIEEKMMQLKARKLELYKALLEDGSGSASAGLTREDFDFLLG